MEYRVLGKTGLKISRIGLGGIPIQRIDAEGTKQLVHQLMEAGVNYIDTARGYTVSEQYLGYALEGIRDKFVLATKSMSRTYDAMAKDIDISLGNLKTDYIDLYQVHNPNMAQLEQVTGEGGALEALLEAKEQGKIGHIGLTAHSLEVFEKALELPWVETIMFPYNIVETQGEELIKKAAQKNIGFVDMKPLAGGAIEDAALAVRFLVSNPDVTVVIPGMADPRKWRSIWPPQRAPLLCLPKSRKRSSRCVRCLAPSSAAAVITALPAPWASRSPASSCSRAIWIVTVWPTGPRIVTAPWPSRPLPASSAVPASPAVLTVCPSVR